MERRPLRGAVAVTNPRQVWFITGAHAVNEFYSVALPPILHLLVADFDLTLGQAGALLTVFYVMYSVFQLPAGALADRVGKKPVLGVGMVVLAAGIFVAAHADSYGTLVGAQVLAGIGGSTYHPTGMSLISDLETGGTEGKAMGIHGLGGVTGTAMAPAIIGGLAVVFDWRIALMAGAAVGVVFAILFVLWFPGREGDEPQYAGDGGEPPERSRATSDPPPEGILPASNGLAGRASSALNVPLAWWVAGLFVANLLISLEIGAVRTFAASYLVIRTGGSTAVANAVFFVMLAGGGVASLGAGHLADRMDRRTLGVGVLALSAGALAATAAVPGIPLVLTAWFFALGVVLYAAFPAMNALTSAYAEREFSGSLFGVMLTAGALGGAGGPVLVGVVAERVGLVVAFPLIAAVSVAAVAAFLALYRV